MAAVSHYNVQPVINIYGSVQGRDLGGVARDLDRIVDESQKGLPRGSRTIVRGQIDTMRSSFSGLLAGLVFSIVLVYLLIVVNFQSWLDPLIIISALPAGLAGILWFLFATGTTFSVPAMIGAIMCVGVATSNSILVVSFAKEQMEDGVRRHGGGAGGRVHAFSPRHHDGAGHDYRHGAHGAGSGRGRRAKRSPGPGGDRRPAVCHRGDAVLCSHGVQRGPWRTESGKQ